MTKKYTDTAEYFISLRQRGIEKKKTRIDWIEKKKALYDDEVDELQEGVSLDKRIISKIESLDKEAQKYRDRIAEVVQEMIDLVDKPTKTVDASDEKIARVLEDPRVWESSVEQTYYSFEYDELVEKRKKNEKLLEEVENEIRRVYYRKVDV